jgi:hypothetical protein
MQIVGHSIIYAGHKVVCNPGPAWSEKFIADYIEEMAHTLSAVATMREHAKELRNMNNDGSWGIKKL